MVRAPASMILMPTLVEPVKLTMSTLSSSTSTAPTSGLAPVTMLTTPGGNPTSSRILASSMTHNGSWGAGFMTTVQPTARAGAILPTMFVVGKLYGEMQATTPTGTRLTTPPMRAPAASGVEAIG